MEESPMRLMVCYDGSNVAKDAIDLAVDLGKILFGSTAQYVIIKAACPVITVK
jgi:hypothetical protein